MGDEYGSMEEEGDESDSDSDSTKESDVDSSNDSSESKEDINWQDLTLEEMIKRDKVYQFGKKLNTGDLPQYVLQNLPSRFMASNEDYNEQTHMLPNPWKRIFFHYKEDKITLPNNAATKTVQSEFKHIDFGVIEWAEPAKEEKNEEDEDESEDEDEMG